MLQIRPISAGNIRGRADKGTATWRQTQGVEPCQTEPDDADTVATEPAVTGMPDTVLSDFNAVSVWTTISPLEPHMPQTWRPPHPAHAQQRARTMTTRYQIVAVLATVLVTYTAGLSLLTLLVELVP